MKNLTKKAIVLASAIAVAGTFAVCAATYSSLTATDTTTDSRSVTVSFATDVASTDQITILAYYAPTGTETPDATNIVFIDQADKAALSQITFSLRDTDLAGNYKVLMGGTGVQTAGNDTFTMTVPPTGYTVSGTVGPVVYFGDPQGDPMLEQANADYKTTASLWDETYTNKLNTVTVDSSLGETGSFSFASVADGNYILTLERAGKCTKAVAVTVSGQNMDLGAKTLKGIDLNDDFSVDAIDIGLLVDIYLDGSAVNYGDVGFNTKGDENGDSSINSIDIGNAVDAYLSFSDPQAPYQEI